MRIDGTINISKVAMHSIDAIYYQGSLNPGASHPTLDY